MGTIEQKLNKIIQTKRRLKNNINSLGGGLTESSKFSDYPLALSQLYSRLPKTTYQEGTNINLGKTLKAVVQYEDDKVLYGDTLQEGTPTPESSIPISVVTGTQEVVVRGKNLLNLDSFTSGSNYGVTYTKDNSQITYSGTTDRSITVINKVDTGTTLKAGTYAISYTTSGSVTRGNLDAQFSVKKDDGTNLFTKLASQMSTNTQYSGTFTITEDTNIYLNLYVNGSGIVFNDFTIQYQIESGSTATSYEPYIESTTQTLHLTGKNLFNKEEIDLINALTTTTGLLSPSNSYRFCGYIPVTPLSTYYLSLSNKTIVFYDKHRHFLGSHVVNGNFFTAWDTARYVGFNITQEQYNTKTQDTLMFSQSSTEVPYEPYNSIELAKIGDYADEIVYDLKTDKWYKKGYIGKVVLNGSESWISASAINNHYRYYINFSSGKADTSLICYSNYFKGVSRVNLLNENELATNQFINILSDTFTSLADLKTWLSTHNTEVYYVLATETLEEITDTTLIEELKNLYNMQSVNGTTIIEGRGNLPMNTKVRAIKGE